MPNYPSKNFFKFSLASTVLLWDIHGVTINNNMTKKFNTPDGYNITPIKPRSYGNHRHDDDCDSQMIEQQAANRAAQSEQNERDNDNTVQE